MTRVRVRARVWRVSFLVGLAFASLPASAALADTTIGQVGGNGPCFQNVLADANYVVPSGGGSITSFSFQSLEGNAGEHVDFLVLRPVSGTTYTLVGHTGVVTLQGTSGGVETFSPPAPIAVQGGDILGVWIPTVLDQCLRNGVTGGGLVYGDNISSEPSVGDPVSLPNSNSTIDLNESANVAPAVPTSVAQCMNGGWQSFGMFKNQGDCVSFVATGGKNPPSGS